MMSTELQKQGQPGSRPSRSSSVSLKETDPSVTLTEGTEHTTTEIAKKKLLPHTLNTIKGRPRKRKTTLLAIGSTRQARSETTTDASSTALVAIAGDSDSNEILTATETLPNDATQNQVDKESQQSHMPLIAIPPVIPENTTGKPPLSSFCTSFPNPKKPRNRRKTDNAAPAQATAIPEQELPLPNSTQHAGPQVQIVNGEIVLQQSSIVFQGSGATQAHQENEAMTVVEEEAQLAVVGATYTSFATGRRARSNVQQWTVEETQLFYEALRQVGLDFGTMEAYFENAEDSGIRKRTRRQLKQKYKAEITKNPSLVEKALKPTNRRDIDLSVFQLTEEAVQELQNEKEKLRLSGENVVEEITNDVDKDIAEEEDVDEEISSAQNLSSSSPSNHKDTLEDNFWPQTQNSIDNEEEHDDAVIVEDPILFEVQDHEEEGTSAIALVHGVVATPSRKKPKFRSRKLMKQK